VKAVVDKERKKELKPYLDAFWEWGCVMAQLLPVTDWEYVSAAKHLLRDEKVLLGGPWAGANKYDGDKVQRIIMEDGHALRVPLLALFTLRSDIRYIGTQGDKRKVRRQFNQWVNVACGLITTTKEE